MFLGNGSEEKNGRHSPCRETKILVEREIKKTRRRERKELHLLVTLLQLIPPSSSFLLKVPATTMARVMSEAKTEGKPWAGITHRVCAWGWGQTNEESLGSSSRPPSLPAGAAWRHMGSLQHQASQAAPARQPSPCVLGEHASTAPIYLLFWCWKQAVAVFLSIQSF